MRKQFYDILVEKGLVAWWKRRKHAQNYVSHCERVCDTGFVSSFFSLLQKLLYLKQTLQNLSTTAAKRLILQVHVRDCGDLSTPAVQVTGTLLIDEQQTNKLSSVDLLRPTNEHSTNSSGPSESLDSVSISNIQILTEAINNLVLPSLCKAHNANSQSRYVLHVQYNSNKLLVNVN